MSNQNLIDTPEFKKILCLDINFTYYEDKHPDGLPSASFHNFPEMANHRGLLGTDEEKDFWDFSMNIKDFYQHNLFNTFEQISSNYYEYLIAIHKKFVKKIYGFKTASNSKEDHLSNLFKTLELLKVHEQGYFSKEIDADEPEFAFNGLTHIDIKFIPNDPQKHFPDNTLTHISIDRFSSAKKKYIKLLIGFIENHIKTLNASSDLDNRYNKNVSFDFDLCWKAKDTDLLELLVALLETGYLARKGKALTRKEAILYCEKIFSMKIKDPESKLTRATERKKDTSPFLSSLKTAFDNYARRKLD